MERVVSGYCRTQDQARTVMAELEDGQWDFACAFPDCAFISECQIAKELKTLKDEYQ